MVSTGQNDPSAPDVVDESTTKGAGNMKVRALSSSKVDLNEQEWLPEKPKAHSSVEINRAKWDALFRRFQKYKDKFGDCLVPN